MKGILRAAGMVWAETVMEGVFFIMQTYFTNVWKLSFTHAATILNIWGGLYRILPLFFLYLADTLLGNIMSLALSGIFSTTGIILVTVATAPVFGYSVSGGKCQGKESGCVGHSEKALFITGLALIALGRGARVPTTELFIRDQSLARNQQRKTPTWWLIICVLAFLTTPLAVIISFPYVKKWYILFGISACCTTLATLFYFSGMCTYYVGDDEENGNPVTDFGRAFESAKALIRMVPIMSTFIMFGVVASIGNTYFIEQASHMNSNIGKWEPPLQLLLLSYTLAKYTVNASMAKYKIHLGRKGGSECGVYAAIFSVLCCAVAAAVERRRVHVLRGHDLLDLPDDGKVPMSAAWLYFQISFLASMESFSEYSLSLFLDNRAPKSMRSYLDCLVEGVTGVGYLCGALSVYVVGKVSETGDANNWFQYTLNRSRLDRYYWVLTVLCTLNLIAFVVGHESYEPKVTEFNPDDVMDNIIDGVERVKRLVLESMWIKKGTAIDLLVSYYKA